ncbi:MAG: peptidoglycan DD-metalloendopeptidase family protein [Lysinibacillus sp.]
MSLKEKIRKRRQGFVESFKNHGMKISLAAVLLTATTFTLGFANADLKDEIKEIYHIYSGNEYIGAVSEEETIEKMIEKKKEEASSQYKDLTLEAGSNITIIPEQVFTVAVNEAETVEKLASSLAVEAEAHALLVDGKAVAYLKNAEDYEKAIRLLKLRYVSQEELDALEGAATELVPLNQNDQTRVTEVSLTKPVTGEEAKADPSQILTPEEAVELLLSGALEKETYAVQQGDVLGSIASAHNLTLKELLALNPGLTESSLLKIGQPVNVTVAKPFVAVKVVMEKFKVETIDFKHITEKDETMLKGESKVKQEGKAGQKEVLYTITSENGIRTGKQATNEVVTAEPVDYINVVGTKVIPSRGTGQFVWPAVGGYVSSQMGPRWGTQHRGIDIARPSNYTIKASDNGVVTFTGWDGSYGNKIVINHNNGYETTYAHLASITVSVGQVVGQGSEIGIMGSTGNSTGTHLHFEVQKNGSLVNPLSLLQ